MFCSVVVFFFKQKTAYEMRISDWSSDVCSSDLFETFELYAAAVRVAVAVPAHTVVGIRAKLALVIIAARPEHARIYMYDDREWLEAVLGDLARLAAERQSSSNPLAGPPRDRQDC